MKWFVNLKTRHKLYAGFSVVIVLLLVLIGSENMQSSASRSQYELTLEVHVPLNLAGNELIMYMLQDRFAFDEIIRVSAISEHSEQYQKAKETYILKARKVSALQLKLRHITEAITFDVVSEELRDELDAVHKLIGVLEKNQQAFGQLSEKLLERLERHGYESTSDLRERLAENKREMSATIDLLSYELNKQIDTANERIETVATNTMIGRIALLSIGILIVIFLATVISNLIAKPLTAATRIAERLGRGDTTVRIETDRTDEVGELLNTLEKLRQHSEHEAQVAAQIADGDLTVDITPLSDQDVLGKALARMVEGLRTQIREMIEGINVLATATAELSSTMVQIGAGARETANAVTETASTLMEIKQASQLSNEKAGMVSDNAQHTLVVSRDGVESIDKSIHSMENIREQMRSVAESIVRLSEQNQTIGEIVTSVNDLAEQSNILAVNAAIEAAKAGDYGKGFTVVAREIRNHAEQSKQATSRVRALLTDTQKATASAVMVAEQGTKLAEGGAQLSSESGKSIEIVMHGIDETAQSMLQISASAKEQLIGLDQVTTAIQHIKQASEQNVESIHQVEITAQNLKELGSRLQRFVERYKLTNRTNGSRSN